MSRNISNITEITKLMDESKATGITTKGPDVNESYLKFSVNRKGDIRFGLGAIKGVGESAVHSILEERERNGEYKDIFDFVQLVTARILKIWLWQVRLTVFPASSVKISL